MNGDFSIQLSENRELEHRLSAALAAYGVPSLKDVVVEARGEKVRLRGRVHTFYAKQVAYHIATRLAGAHQVDDELEVVRPAEFRDPCSTRRWFVPAAVALVLAVMFVTGCSKSEAPRVPVHPVTGQVTVNGRPAAGAFVVFHPKEGTGAGAPSAMVDKQGNYHLTTYEARDGAPSGDYVVTVVLQPPVQKDGEFERGPNVLPPHLAKPATSKIVAHVAEGANVVPISIKR
jgi:hypothetical protein